MTNRPNPAEIVAGWFGIIAAPTGAYMILQGPDAWQMKAIGCAALASLFYSSWMRLKDE